MAQHAHDDAEHDAHAGGDERMGREILADRERMFDSFVGFSAWGVVIALVIVAFLALTQT